MPLAVTDTDPLSSYLEALPWLPALAIGLLMAVLGVRVLLGWWQIAGPLFPRELPPPAWPSWRVLAVAFLTTAVCAGPLAVPEGLAADQRVHVALRNIMALLAITSAAALLTHFLERGSRQAMGLTLPRPLAAVPLAAGTWVALLPLIFAALALRSGAYALWGRAAPEQAAAEALADFPSLRGDLFLLAGVIVIQPILEEVIYRGVLLGFFRRSLPAAAASVLDSVLFAAVHDGSHLQVFVLSLALCTLRLRTGSLLAPCLLHIMNNGVTVSWILG